jgi:hypothetical protein
VIVFERHLPVTALAQVLAHLVRGRLPTRIELGVPVRIYSFPPSSVGSEEHPGRTGFTFAPVERFARFQLKMSGGGSQPGGTVFTHEVHVVCDREMRAQGLGSVGDVIHALGLTRNADELHVGGDECICEVVACIPARIAGVTQTADRTQAVVMTDVAPELLGRVALMMTTLNVGWRNPVAGALDARGRAVFVLDDDHDVDFTLLYEGYPAQSERFKRLPRAHLRVRERAVAYIEGDAGSLLRDGLLQVRDPDANAFERSVLHLFGLMGFAGFWWGPNRQNGKPKLPMPASASDCLVFSSDDSVVALIECTVAAPGRDKTLKLIRRARVIQRDLQASHGDGSLAVVPVLAAAAHKDDISNVVRELCDSDGLVLLSNETLTALHDLVVIGATDAEIEAALPEPLRAGLACERLFSRIF